MSFQSYRWLTPKLSLTITVADGWEAGEYKMKYKVIVYATFETEVDADSQDEAEEKAVDESPFPYADYCESEMV